MSFSNLHDLLATAPDSVEVSIDRVRLTAPVAEASRARRVAQWFMVLFYGNVLLTPFITKLGLLGVMPGVMVSVAVFGAWYVARRTRRVVDFTPKRLHIDGRSWDLGQVKAELVSKADAGRHHVLLDTGDEQFAVDGGQILYGHLGKADAAWLVAFVNAAAAECGTTITAVPNRAPDALLSMRCAVA